MLLITVHFPSIKGLSSFLVFYKTYLRLLLSAVWAIHLNSFAKNKISLKIDFILNFKISIQFN